MNNEPTTGTRVATRSFPAKKKATPKTNAAETELPPCFTNSKASFLSIASIMILLPLLPLRSALSRLPLLSLRSALTVVFELLWLTMIAIPMNAIQLFETAVNLRHKQRFMFFQFFFTNVPHISWQLILVNCGGEQNRRKVI